MCSRRRWPVRRSLLWVGGAFAVGCVPSARLVARRLAGIDIDAVGDGKPGAANVRQTVGAKAGYLVAGMDLAKGYLPATLAKLGGAGENTVGAVAVAPELAHILVTGGRGAVAAMGGAFAIDTPAMLIAGAGIVAGTKAGYHPQSVVIGAFGLLPIRLLLRRRALAGFWGVMPGVILVFARLRGSADVGPATDPAVLWNRFWIDRDH
jgi:glycerol-3-phosphate acyltransferase PlsY